MTIEIAVFNIESAIMAAEAGANRIELCSALSDSGLTPSAGTIIQAIQAVKIPVYVMIRPREGNFVYSNTEFKTMLSDIDFAVTHGASGIVCGILNKDNTVDTIRMQQIVECAGSLGVTFHRAFDMTTDKMKAAEDIIACGCERILTSGGEATAMEGKLMIKQLVSDTSGRIIIMPGSGINHTNYQHLISETGAKEIHLSAKKLIKETQHQATSNKPILINSDYYLTDKQMISQIQRSFQQ